MCFVTCNWNSVVILYMQVLLLLLAMFICSTPSQFVNVYYEYLIGTPTLTMSFIVTMPKMRDIFYILHVLSIHFYCI